MLLSQYYKRANLYALLNLLVLSVVIYTGVDIFYTLAGSKLAEVKTEQTTSAHFKQTAKPGKRRSFGHYLSAINRNLFGQVDKPVDKTPEELNVEDLEATTLRITLLGTVSGDPENTVAVIHEHGKRSQSLYKEGDAIQNATIAKILRGKVVLRVGDKNQILSMEEQPKSGSSVRRRSPSRAPSTRPQPGSTITLDRATVTESLQNISELLSQVRVRPHYKNGQPDGLMLSQVKPRSIFTRLGLRNGDIIQGVDNEAIESPDDIMDFYEELKSGSSISLELMRRGKRKTLNYRFR